MSSPPGQLAGGGGDMTASSIIDPRIRGRASAGPLGPYVEAFASRMQEQGFSAGYAREQVRVVAELSWWLEQQRVRLRDLAEVHLTAFVARAWRPSKRRLDHALVQRLLGEWRHAGIVATSAPVLRDARTPIEHAFAQSLRDERGLTAATQQAALRVVRQFLAERFGDTRVVVGTLEASDLTGFVRRHLEAHGPRNAGTFVWALRSFVRFLVARGEVPAALATCIPAVARWRDATLPGALTPAAVARLLGTCDRRTPTARP